MNPSFLCDSLSLLAAFSLSDLLHQALTILLVLVGIGLVIFFHELGHFAVAKWCDVFVERFSIGFGPILLSRKYGETEYALSAIPFGGYVKMLGQDDMDPSQLTSAELARDPRSYSAKSVWQRMAIISAGVTMNVLTAVLFYAFAFGRGIEMPPSIVGSLQPGFPAWEAGLQPGDRITSTAGRETTTFEDILRGIAFSSGPVEIHGIRENGSPFDVRLTPAMSNGRRVIGVSPAYGLEVYKPADPSEHVAVADSAASRAEPAFEPEDRIVKLDGQAVSDYAELQKLLAQRRDKTVTFQVAREKSKTPVDIRVEPQRLRQIGVTMDIGKITALIKDSPAERNGILVGDKILRVNNRSVGTEIDPLKLPDELAGQAGHEITIDVQREIKGSEAKTIPIRLVPENKPGWVEAPFTAENPFSAPAIGIAYNVVPTVLEVAANSPADREGIKKGDRIKLAELVIPEGEPADQFGKKPLKADFSTIPGDWAYVVYMMQKAPRRDLRLTLVAENRTVTCTPVIDPHGTQFMPDQRGLNLYHERIMLKSKGIADAAYMGFIHTRNSIVDLYLTLRNLFTNQLSVENLHGPLGIASVAYDVAKQGLAEMSLFLGVLSANLAVLNFLPIPVLDGGHMVFLIWEAVTRKRPSERVQIAATYFGMAFVLSLAILVFWLDIVVHRVLG